MVDLHYVWVAKYNDGTELRQNDGAKYDDIVQDKLIALEVYKNPDEQFVLAIPIPSDSKAVCFIRGAISKLPDGSETHVREFWFGYKTLTRGVSVKNLIFIREDGLIVLQNESDSPFAN